MKELDQFIPDGLDDALLVKGDAKHSTSTFNPISELNELISASVGKNDAPQVFYCVSTLKCVLFTFPCCIIHSKV